MPKRTVFPQKTPEFPQKKPDRAGSHRGRRVPRPLIAALVVVLPLATAFTADRIAAGVAAGRLADRLRCAADLPSEPSVEFGGPLFLAQAARGRFDSVRVAADGVPAGRFRVGVAATATGVRLPRHGAVRAASLTADLTLGYADLSALTGRDDSAAASVTADGDGRLRIVTTRHVFGREVPVTVIAAPEIAGNRLTVRPVEVEVTTLGLRLPASRLPGGAVSGTGRAGAGLPGADLPGLPAGLSYRGVLATDDGLRLTVAGSDVGADLAGRATGRGGRTCVTSQTAGPAGSRAVISGRDTSAVRTSGLAVRTSGLATPRSGAGTRVPAPVRALDDRRVTA